MGGRERGRGLDLDLDLGLEQTRGRLLMGRYRGKQRLGDGDHAHYYHLIALHRDETFLFPFAIKQGADEFCLFVNLDRPIPLGVYWMQIRGSGLDAQTGRPIFDVVPLRPIPERLYDGDSSSASGDFLPGCDVDGFLENIMGIPSLVRNNFTLRGLLNAIRFVLVLLLTSMIGLYRAVVFVGYFTISLMSELNLLVERLTPIFLASLDFFTRLVGGFYIILASWLRIDSSAEVRRDRRPAIRYDRPSVGGSFGDASAID